MFWLIIWSSIVLSVRKHKSDFFTGEKWWFTEVTCPRSHALSGGVQIQPAGYTKAAILSNNTLYHCVCENGYEGGPVWSLCTAVKVLETDLI